MPAKSDKKQQLLRLLSLMRLSGPGLRFPNSQYLPHLHTPLMPRRLLVFDAGDHDGGVDLDGGAGEGEGDGVAQGRCTRLVVE